MSPRLRWLTIIVPAIAVGAIELLSDSVLDAAFPIPLDFLLIVGAVLVVSAIISWFTFGRIDALAAELAAQNRALQARNSSARALHRVSVAITALAELDGILEAVVGSARDLLGADAAVLLLAGPDGRLGLRAGSGPPDAIRPAAIDGDDEVLRFVDPTWAVSRLAAPLQRGGRTIGLLAIASRVPRSFGVDDIEALATLANQASIAIENAHLQARLRELAVVAERERIAREMHDGLAQVLGYVNTKSQAVDEYLATGRVDEARVQLAELSGAARSVYVDVREAILGLRSPIEPGAGLVGAVEEYARRFAEASKLAVVVEATTDARTAYLSPEAEAQVFRIIQEALTNVRKHAIANRATLTLDVEGEMLVIRVADDGRGFAASGSPSSGPRATSSNPAGWPHYGLEAMRERATSIGGTIEWSSRADSGAVVRLAVPVGPAAVAADVLPGLPADVLPGLPADVLPGHPTTSARVADALPGLPTDVLPGHPADVLPGHPATSARVADALPGAPAAQVPA